MTEQGLLSATSAKAMLNRDANILLRMYNARRHGTDTGQQERLHKNLAKNWATLSGFASAFLNAFDATAKPTGAQVGLLRRWSGKLDEWVVDFPFVGSVSERLERRWIDELKALQKRAKKTAAKHAPGKTATPKKGGLSFDIAPDKMPDAALIEQLAHRYAYKDSLSGDDAKWLAYYGYTMLEVQNGANDCQWVRFTANKAGKALKRKDVVAFRGTAGLRDLIADLGKNAVGLDQFAGNIGAVTKTLAQCIGRPIVTGHSLGGALAQLAACHLPELVGKVVTFQAPAIDRASVKKLAKYNADPKNKNKKVRSEHHIAAYDPVAAAGNMRTPGTVHEYGIIGDVSAANSAFRLTGLGYNLPKHVSYPVAAALQGGQGRQVRSGASPGGTAYGVKSYSTGGQTGKYANANHAGNFVEGLRRTGNNAVHSAMWNKRHQQIQKALALLRAGKPIAEAIKGLQFKPDIAQVKQAWAAMQKHKKKASGK